ncbi:MAG: aldehyde dehydrogenase family protein [Streptosporangiaceae bacterium]
MNQQLYIAGKWTDADATFEVRDPYTSGLLATVASASAGQATAAVDAAATAERLPAYRRAEILREAADQISARAAEFAASIVAEAGKPVSAARTEVDRAIDTLRLAAEEARRLHGEAVPMDAVGSGDGMLSFTIPQPAGVVAAITPFNFPLNLVLHKVGPALAAGCPVVLKPSEKTPLTAGLLASVLDGCGLPAGWFNLVTGEPSVVVGAWLADPRVSVVTFTGSASVGWQLKAASPGKRHILELGSNTAVYVAADADLDAAVAAAVAGAFSYSGQACISLQRVYADRSIAAELTARLATAADGLDHGDPRDASTVVGPLISTEARDRVLSWISEAILAGAVLSAGGDVRDGILRPTVLSDVPDSARLMCEEAFGPVVSVRSVAGPDEAIAAINASRFGLNAAVYTRDLSTALDFAQRVEAGTVLVNRGPSYRADHAPYGGVKESGEGREGVRYAVQSLLDPKLVILGAS